MKSLIKISSTVMFCLILSGCFPCKLGDWNCSQIDPTWSKNIDKCQSTQRNIAKSILKDRYSDKIDSEIGSSCIQNTNYKFKMKK